MRFHVILNLFKLINNSLEKSRANLHKKSLSFFDEKFKIEIFSTLLDEKKLLNFNENPGIFNIFIKIL